MVTGRPLSRTHPLAVHCPLPATHSATHLDISGPGIAVLHLQEQSVALAIVARRRAPSAGAWRLLAGCQSRPGSGCCMGRSCQESLGPAQASGHRGRASRHPRFCLMLVGVLKMMTAQPLQSLSSLEHTAGSKQQQKRQQDSALSRSAKLLGGVQSCLADSLLQAGSAQGRGM